MNCVVYAPPSDRWVAQLCRNRGGYTFFLDPGQYICQENNKGPGKRRGRRASRWKIAAGAWRRSASTCVTPDAHELPALGRNNRGAIRECLDSPWPLREIQVRIGRRVRQEHAGKLLLRKQVEHLRRWQEFQPPEASIAIERHFAGSQRQHDERLLSMPNDE